MIFSILFKIIEEFCSYNVFWHISDALCKTKSLDTVKKHKWMKRMNQLKEKKRAFSPSIFFLTMTMKEEELASLRIGSHLRRMSKLNPQKVCNRLIFSRLHVMLLLFQSVHQSSVNCSVY